MTLTTLCIVSILGLAQGTTLQSPIDCYTQPPGRQNGARVMTCQDKYVIIPGQLFCQMNIRRHPLSVTDIAEILAKHNDIRAGVSPKAASMLSLQYTNGLGRSAQIWAEMCQLQKSTPLQRFRPGSFTVGENVYVSQANMTWTDVIEIWAQEKTAFTYASSGNNQSLVSNYVQLVWAQTSAVGCAKADCFGKYFYVCHYAPAMNYSNINRPYETSTRSCSQCTNCTSSLCDCRGIICLNGAKLNYRTCQCDCITSVKTYEPPTCEYCRGIICLNGAKMNYRTCKCDSITGVKANEPPTCELRCERNGDYQKCGTIYKQTTCRSSFQTMFHCPWLCDLCSCK